MSGPRPLAPSFWDFSSRSRSKGWTCPSRVPSHSASPRRGLSGSWISSDGQLALEVGQVLGERAQGAGIGAELFQDVQQLLDRAVGEDHGARPPGLKLDPLDPEPVAAPFGGEAADLGHEPLRIGVQTIVQGRGAGEDHADGQQTVGIGLGLEQAIELLGRAVGKVRLAVQLRELDAAPFPADLIQPVEDRLEAPVRIDGHDQAPFRTGLADVPALHVAGEDDRRVLAGDLAGVDVTQGPVVVTPDPKFLERAGGVPFMTVRAAETGMQQADVDATANGRRIGGGQVLRDGGLREALPVDRHVQVGQKNVSGRSWARSRTFSGNGRTRVILLAASWLPAMRMTGIFWSRSRPSSLTR